MARIPEQSGSTLAARVTNVDGRASALETHTDGWVNVRSYGAAGDGVTDDTEAIQAALDFSLGQDRPPPVVLSGRHRVTSTLIIDRPVDSTTSELRIIGSGPGAGFYVSSDVLIFGSSLPVTTMPQSEGVSFENLHFEADVNSRDARVLQANKFLRLRFTNCNFRKIRLVTNTIYAQTFHFIGCNIRGWSDVFMYARGSYDVSFLGCVVEAGGPGSTLIHSVGLSGGSGTVGMRIVGCLIEGIKGSALRATGVAGLTVTGNYFEAVGQDGTEPTINLYAGDLNNECVFLGGNFFGDTQAFGWNVLWGPTRGGVSIGNVASTGGLHDDLASLYRIQSVGDVATAGDVFRSGRPAGNEMAVDSRGDASVALTVAADSRTQLFADTLTGNRSVTLSTDGAVNGDSFRIVRTGLGSFTLDVGGLKTLPSGTAAWADVVFDGSQWRLAGYGAL